MLTVACNASHTVVDKVKVTRTVISCTTAVNVGRVPFNHGTRCDTAQETKLLVMDDSSRYCDTGPMEWGRLAIADEEVCTWTWDRIDGDSRWSWSHSQ